MRPFRRGDTLKRGGVLTLPPSAWTGRVELFDMRAPEKAGDWGIVVSIVNPVPTANPRFPGQSDYTVLFDAPASVTAAWPVKGGLGSLDLQGRLILTDALGQVASSARFALRVEA